ncbi:hypothetical protein DIPPA_04700 [Diplonema papillatum]|nr:hypothetical protein DIPPA_04700 [Diplonema papillatum]|eukprot:gene17398-26733_t
MTEDAEEETLEATLRELSQANHEATARTAALSERLAKSEGECASLREDLVALEEVNAGLKRLAERRGSAPGTIRECTPNNCLATVEKEVIMRRLRDSAQAKKELKKRNRVLQAEVDRLVLELENRPEADSTKEGRASPANNRGDDDSHDLVNELLRELSEARSKTHAVQADATRAEARHKARIELLTERLQEDPAHTPHRDASTPPDANGTAKSNRVESPSDGSFRSQSRTHRRDDAEYSEITGFQLIGSDDDELTEAQAALQKLSDSIAAVPSRWRENSGYGPGHADEVESHLLRQVDPLLGQLRKAQRLLRAELAQRGRRLSAAETQRSASPDPSSRPYNETEFKALRDALDRKAADEQTQAAETARLRLEIEELEDKLDEERRRHWASRKPSSLVRFDETAGPASDRLARSEGRDDDVEAVKSQLRASEAQKARMARELEAAQQRNRELNAESGEAKRDDHRSGGLAAEIRQLKRAHRDELADWEEKYLDERDRRLAAEHRLSQLLSKKDHDSDNNEPHLREVARYRRGHSGERGMRSSLSDSTNGRGRRRGAGVSTLPDTDAHEDRRSVWDSDRTLASRANELQTDNAYLRRRVRQLQTEVQAEGHPGHVLTPPRGSTPEEPYLDLETPRPVLMSRQPLHPNLPLPIFGHAQSITCVPARNYHQGKQWSDYAASPAFVHQPYQPQVPQQGFAAMLCQPRQVAPLPRLSPRPQLSPQSTNFCISPTAVHATPRSVSAPAFLHGAPQARLRMPKSPASGGTDVLNERTGADPYSPPQTWRQPIPIKRPPKGVQENYVFS